MRSLIAFRLTSTHKDYCVVGTDAGKITILEYLPETSEVRTTSIGGLGGWETVFGASNGSFVLAQFVVRLYTAFSVSAQPASVIKRQGCCWVGLRFSFPWRG